MYTPSSQQIHYMNHQVHSPFDPQQLGPIFFLNPCKCAIFGVCCEAIQTQVGLEIFNVRVQLCFSWIGEFIHVQWCLQLSEQVLEYLRNSILRWY